MDWKTLKAQVKAQIDKEFPVERRKMKMTPLHTDVILLVSTAQKPVRMRQLALLLCGNAPKAPGWVDKVCTLADALNELREAEVLDCSTVGWTKTESTDARQS